MPLVNSEIESSLRKLRKSLKSATKRLTPEDVHKLRTRARRVVSLSETRSWPSLRKAKLTKPLERIRKKAGRVRDMDVLTSHLAGMHADRDPSCRTQLLEYLGAKRYRRADRLTALLEEVGPPLRKALRRLAKGVARETRGKRGNAAGKANARHSAQVLELTAGLGEPAHLDRSNLHIYRLMVKELRDALRMAGAAGDSRFAEALGQCKNAIGEWHDWEELIVIAEKILDDGPRCQLLGELKAVSKRKFLAALETAERLRTDYARRQSNRAKAGRVERRRAHERGGPNGPRIPERALRAVAGAIR